MSANTACSASKLPCISLINALKGHIPGIPNTSYPRGKSNFKSKSRFPAEWPDCAFLVFRTDWYRRSLEFSVRLNKRGLYPQKKVPTVFLEFCFARSGEVLRDHHCFPGMKFEMADNLFPNFVWCPCQVGSMGFVCWDGCVREMSRVNTPVASPANASSPPEGGHYQPERVGVVLPSDGIT